MKYKYENNGTYCYVYTPPKVTSHNGFSTLTRELVEVSFYKSQSHRISSKRVYVAI